MICCNNCGVLSFGLHHCLGCGERIDASDLEQRHAFVSRLIAETGMAPVDKWEWRVSLRGFLLAIQRVGDGTWWLTVAGANEDPSMEFSGTLGGCLLQYAAVRLAIQAGMWKHPLAGDKDRRREENAY